MEKREILYKLSKTGSVLRFETIARTVEDGAVLITRKGTLRGAVQEDIEPMYPKNVGRANETSPWQQSLIMFNSKVNKLKDKGYKEILLGEDITYNELLRILMDQEGTDAAGNILPMLAQKDTNKIRFPGYVQPKMDGMRGLIENQDGEIIIRSRNGKILEYLPHIAKALKKSLPKNWWIDGELYHHEKSLQQIVSMVKRDQPANKLIEFRAYDCIPGYKDTPFERRKSFMYGIVNKSGDPIHEVNTHLVHNMDELMGWFTHYKSLGYEGVMWRDSQGPYEAGRRSWYLIKVKGFEEEEFEIVGGKEATGRDAGTVIFTCKTDQGEIFDVRPCGSRALRREYFENIDSLIGSQLTVRFQQWTDDGKPFHARGIVIRDYE